MLEVRLIVRDTDDGYVFYDRTESYDGPVEKRSDALPKLIDSAIWAVIGQVQRIGTTLFLERRD